MREVLVTREDVLKAMEAHDRAEDASSSCAMHQALEPFITKSFVVINDKAFNKTKPRYTYYPFTPTLPLELYRSYFATALAHIEANGPYKFQVEGI